MDWVHNRYARVFSSGDYNPFLDNFAIDLYKNNYARRVMLVPNRKEESGHNELWRVGVYSSSDGEEEAESGSEQGDDNDDARAEADQEGDDRVIEAGVGKLTLTADAA